MDFTNFDLVESLNGKSKQGCVVESEMPPEEATFIFDKNYDITVGGRIYNSWDSSVYVGLPETNYSYYIPAADFTFKEVDEVTLDRQIISSD